MRCRREALKALQPCAAALSLFFLSCAGSGEFYQSVDRDVSGGNYLRAAEEVRRNRDAYGEKGSVLYHLDMGLLFHYAGVPDSSDVHLFEAEKEIQDLYTKSISLAAASVILNDNILPYDGEDFEKVLINVFLALNYAERDQPDEALVEARKVDLKLKELARRYEEKNTYWEDAFVRYLTGALYENDGELNDAFIAYRQALASYATYLKEYETPSPPFLLDDLVRTASLLSFEDEADTYRAMGGKEYESTTDPPGSILVIAYSGKAPIKIEQRSSVSVADTSGTLHTFQVALPRFVPRNLFPRTYRVLLRSGAEFLDSVSTSVAENITAIAGKALGDRLSLVYLKSGGRALLKYLLAEKAKSSMAKSGDQVGNFLKSVAVDLAVGATERADLRSWRTLPAEIQLARLDVPPGQYAVTVKASDGGYSIANRSVNVRAGRTEFVIVDDIR